VVGWEFLDFKDNMINITAYQVYSTFIQPFLLLNLQAFGSPYFWFKGSSLSFLFLRVKPSSSVNLKKFGATSINHFGFIAQTSLMYYLLVNIS
jgi:hypothetical protein